MKKQLILLLAFFSISFTLKSQCDSAAIIDTTLVICNGDLSVPGGYDETGIYVDTLLMNGQCTIRTIDLSVAPPIEDQVRTLTICEGDIIPPIVTDPQDTIIIFEGNMLQCTYQEVLNVIVYPTETSITTYEICENDTLEWNGQFFTEPGQYTITTPSTSGCDSNEILNLSILPTTILDTISFCEGEVLVIEGTQIVEAGDYSFEFSGNNGCSDSINVHVVELPTELIQMSECSDTQAPGIYILEGEDCTITELTVFQPTPDVNTLATICPGDSLEWNGVIYTAPTIVGLTMEDSNGCTYTDMLTIEYGSDANCVTSVKDQIESDLFTLYPNPATDFLLLTVLENKNLNTRIEIYNTQGHLIQASSLNSYTVTLDISNMDTGLYILKATEADNRIQTQSFIKM